MATLIGGLTEFREHPASFVMKNMTFFNLLCVSIGINVGILSLAALTNLKRWRRRGSSDHDFFPPFILGWIGSILWSLYGIFANNWQVIAVNGFLTIINTVVLIGFVFYRIRKRFVIFVAAMVCFTLTLVTAHLFNMPWNISANIVGSICSFMQILCACTMIYIISLAISRKRIDFVPFPPVAQIFNIELQVSIYSILIKDYYLLAANGVFMIIDGIVFFLFFVYPSELPEQLNKLKLTEV